MKTRLFFKNFMLFLSFPLHLLLTGAVATALVMAYQLHTVAPDFFAGYKPASFWLFSAGLALLYLVVTSVRWPKHYGFFHALWPNVSSALFKTRGTKYLNHLFWKHGRDYFVRAETRFTSINPRFKGTVLDEKTYLSLRKRKPASQTGSSPKTAPIQSNEYLFGKLPGVRDWFAGLFGTSNATNVLTVIALVLVILVALNQLLQAFGWTFVLLLVGAIALTLIVGIGYAIHYYLRFQTRVMVGAYAVLIVVLFLGGGFAYAKGPGYLEDLQTNTFMSMLTNSTDINVHAQEPVTVTDSQPEIQAISAVIPKEEPVEQKAEAVFDKDMQNTNAQIGWGEIGYFDGQLKLIPNHLKEQWDSMPKEDKDILNVSVFLEGDATHTGVSDAVVVFDTHKEWGFDGVDQNGKPLHLDGSFSDRIDQAIADGAIPVDAKPKMVQANSLQNLLIHAYEAYVKSLDVLSPLLANKELTKEQKLALPEVTTAKAMEAAVDGLLDQYDGFMSVNVPGYTPVQRLMGLVEFLVEASEPGKEIIYMTPTPAPRPTDAPATPTPTAIQVDVWTYTVGEISQELDHDAAAALLKTFNNQLGNEAIEGLLNDAQNIFGGNLNSVLQSVLPPPPPPTEVPVIWTYLDNKGQTWELTHNDAYALLDDYITQSVTVQYIEGLLTQAQSIFGGSLNPVLLSLSPQPAVPTPSGTWFYTDASGTQTLTHDGAFDVVQSLNPTLSNVAIEKLLTDALSFFGGNLNAVLQSVSPPPAAP